VGSFIKTHNFSKKKGKREEIFLYMTKGGERTRERGGKKSV